MSAPGAGAPAPATPETDAIDLPLNVQKAARSAVRDLVRKLRNSPAEAWSELIAAAISAEGSIWHFVQAVSVRKAILEANPDAAFADRVVEAMRVSPLVPADINYG